MFIKQTNKTRPNYPYPLPNTPHCPVSHLPSTLCKYPTLSHAQFTPSKAKPSIIKNHKQSSMMDQSLSRDPLQFTSPFLHKLSTLFHLSLPKFFVFFLFTIYCSSSDFFQEHEQCYYIEINCNLATPGDELFSKLESQEMDFGGCMQRWQRIGVQVQWEKSLEVLKINK